MRKNTVLLAVAFVIAGMVSVSCGGDSGTEGSESGAGTTSTGAGTAGTSSTAGTSNPGGGTNSTAGTTNNTSGNSTGGNNPSGGNATGGTNGGNTTGGTNTGGNFGNLPTCAAGTMDGGMCTRMDGMNTCQLDADTVCNCRRQEWTCGMIPDLGGGGQGPGPGAGGDGPGFGNAMCGDTPMDGADCTGFGLCAGSDSCFCSFQDQKVNCP